MTSKIRSDIIGGELFSRSDLAFLKRHELRFNDKLSLELTMPSTVPGRGFSASLARHFVPGYYRAVPQGQKPFPTEAPCIWDRVGESRTLIDNLDRGAQIDVVEECFRHFAGHPDTAMRGWIARQIAFMHSHASGDAHKKRHRGALEY
jgi:hypothetical protein